VSSPRGESIPGALTRLGFHDPRRALTLLDDPVLERVVQRRDAIEDDGLARALAEVADPDQALLGLVRVMEAVCRAPGSELRARVEAGLVSGSRDRRRLLGVLGSSLALTDHLVAHPEHAVDLVEAAPVPVEERVARMTAAVLAADGQGGSAAEDALRVEYRRQLLAVAALDVEATFATDQLPRTAAALADLAQAALAAAHALAVHRLGDRARGCRLAVIAMGKTGGRELNYISDVDVIFAAEPADGVDEDEALAVGTELATAIVRICSTSTGAGSLWQVDPALRPEGKQGPLVRTVASHRAYYERWAKTWEFQALLKARPVAGDEGVGTAYVEAMAPFVWTAAGRENFVGDAQAMRRRVEDHVPRAEAERQLKLGKGGLRDVEFSVQLLQLVHGRADDTLRSGTTIPALEALSRGGYVGREDAAALATAYRFLRTLEHRIQLQRMRRTHLMPTAPADLRRLGRALGYRQDPAEEVVKQWKATAREVRRLHERIFYRPLLAAVARLSESDVRLTPEAAEERLTALGFRDPKGAFRHLRALTEGVSRRAAIQRQLLPAMLGWFADEADPDAGLLAFRKISDELGTTHWYLKMLRDEGQAAERLAHVLGRSRFAADLLEQAPDCVQFLGESAGVQPRSRAEVEQRMRAAAGRQDGLEEAVHAARTIRRAELFRLSVADLEGRLDIGQVGRALTDLAGALLEVALEQVVRVREASVGRPLATALLVVGMGRLGGGELGYGSDADVMFVHDPHEGADEQQAQEDALDVVRELIRVLGLSGPDPRLEIDTALRPEGKNGPLVRSLASYANYYARWSLVWEAQALVRAAPVAGDAGLGERFVALIDPIRWPADGLDAGQLREIRTLKARMEAERLPRGADRKTHFKLGHGGLSDVEWSAQLVQLRHAAGHPELRTPSTLGALAAASRLGLVAPVDAAELAEAWTLASRLRNAGQLWRGRALDALPSDVRDLEGSARVLGRSSGSGHELGEEYRRITRHARGAYERVFFEG
jgi:glutamate-ammonia-ligase adenylyltransferase